MNGARRLGTGLGIAALLLCDSPAVAAQDAVDCLIEPWTRITLSAAIEGVVEEVLVDRGDLVEEGDVLARLESSVERARVRFAKARAEAKGPIQSGQARLEFATAELERQQRLDAQDIVSEKDLDEARSSKRVAEAELLAAREGRLQAELELEQTRAILERRTIRSPIAGVVVERILSPGEYADPPQILELAQVDPLRVEVFAPLELFGSVDPGMEADVITQQPAEGTHRATVTVVDPIVDAASGTFRIRLELPNPDHAVPAGLQCTVLFSTADAPLPGPAAAAQP